MTVPEPSPTDLQCRFCFDVDLRSSLLIPCSCAGTSRYVHRACLDSWRSTNVEAFASCPTCKFNYLIKSGSGLDKSYKSRIKFALLLTRDLVICLSIAGAVVYVVGRLVVHLDQMYAWCQPDCQEPAALVNLELNPARPIGPVCVACAPLHVLFFPKSYLMVSTHVASWTMGSTIIFASLGLVTTMANWFGFVGNLGGAYRPMLNTGGGGGGGNAEGGVGMMIVTTLAIIGAAVALYYACVSLYQRAKGHAKSLRLISIAEDYLVVDVELEPDVDASLLLSTEEVRRAARAATWAS